MKFTIVTPCYNAVSLIGDTVRSISSQTLLDDPSHTIEYILVDGASADGTVDEAIRAWVDHPRASMKIISEPDRGMYDALAKGFSQATGDTISYLNAGDYYSPHCLAVVYIARTRFSSEWLTGMRVTYNGEGAMVSARVPWGYSSSLIRKGYYGVRGRGRFIQQESTFWSRRLQTEIDLRQLARLRLAGDLFLWTEFANRAHLDVVSAHLGGFRFHGDHLSEDMRGYRGEAFSFLARGQLSGYLRAPLHEVLSWVPVPLRRHLRGSEAIWWDPTQGEWVGGRASLPVSGAGSGAVAVSE